jgi:hypothetical protein
MGRLHETGISQKTCQKFLIFKAFGEKSVGSLHDSLLNLLTALIMVIIKNDKYYYGENYQSENIEIPFRSESPLYCKCNDIAIKRTIIVSKRYHENSGSVNHQKADKF